MNILTERGLTDENESKIRSQNDEETRKFLEELKEFPKKSQKSANNRKEISLNAHDSKELAKQISRNCHTMILPQKTADGKNANFFFNFRGHSGVLAGGRGFEGRGLRGIKGEGREKSL